VKRDGVYDSEIGILNWQSGEAGKYDVYQLSDFFSEPFFSTKYLIHLF